MGTWIRTSTILLVILIPAVAFGGYGSGFRMGLMGNFGFGGEYRYETTGFADSKDDADPSAGLTVFGEYPVGRYLVPGLQFGFLSIQSDSGDTLNLDRSTYIDISPAIKGRYQFARNHGEVYVSVPVGLTIGVPSSDVEKSQNVETAVGWNAGVLAGANYNVWSRLGIIVELGWQGHGVSHSRTVGGDTMVTVHQFALRTGFLWAF